jgi:hypothetical protein
MKNVIVLFVAAAIAFTATGCGANAKEKEQAQADFDKALNESKAQTETMRIKNLGTQAEILKLEGHDWTFADTYFQCKATPPTQPANQSKCKKVEERAAKILNRPQPKW